MPDASEVDVYLNVASLVFGACGWLLNVASLVVVDSIKIMGSVRNSRILFVSLQKKGNNYEVYS